METSPWQPLVLIERSVLAITRLALDWLTWPWRALVRLRGIRMRVQIGLAIGRFFCAVADVSFGPANAEDITIDD
jgi:hypothetical protein